MQNRDILWAVSLPFRMYNQKEMDVNKLAFTLSFDAGLPNCNVSVARKLIHLALEKGWLEQDEKFIHAKFELFQPPHFPPSWHPQFSNLEKVPMIELIPLDKSIEYKPELNKTITKPAPDQPFKGVVTIKTVKVEEKEPIEKPPESVKKRRKTSAKKSKTKKQGQKSIQDFFS